MRGVEGYEALVVGARERKVEGRRSSAAGTKFSWPENARESISARVGGDAILFAVRQTVPRGMLTADIACRWRDLKEPFYPEFFSGVSIGKIIVSWGDFGHRCQGWSMRAQLCSTMHV